MSSIAISGANIATLSSDGPPVVKNRLRNYFQVAAVGGALAIFGAFYLGLREQASQEPLDQKPIFDLTTTQEPSFSHPRIDIRRFLASLFPYNLGSLKDDLPPFRNIEFSEKPAHAFPIRCYTERFSIFSNAVSQTQVLPITNRLLNNEKATFPLAAVPLPSFSFPRMDVRKLLSFIFPFNLGPLNDYLPRLKPIEPYVISPETFSINCLMERTPIISNLSQNITPVKREPIINNSSQQGIPDSKFDPKQSAVLLTLAFIVAQMTQEFYLSPSSAFPQPPLVSPFPSFLYEVFTQAVENDNPTAVEIFYFVQNLISKDSKSPFDKEIHNHDLNVLSKLSQFKIFEKQNGKDVSKEDTTIKFCLKTIERQLSVLKSDWAKSILKPKLDALRLAYNGVAESQIVSVKTIRETYFGPQIKIEAMQKVFQLMQSQYSRLVNAYEHLRLQQGLDGVKHTSQRLIYAARSALISAAVALCLFANCATNHFNE